MIINTTPMDTFHDYRLCEKDNSITVVAKSAYDDIKLIMITNNIEIKEDVEVNVLLDFKKLENDLPTHYRTIIVHVLHIDYLL